MDKLTDLQPIEFLCYSKQFIEYSDRKEISKLSKLKINKIYQLLNNGKGKKNALIISRAVLKLLEKKQINDDIIDNYRKKFANKHLK